MSDQVTANEILEFLHEHMMTREEIKADMMTREEIKSALKQQKTEIVSEAQQMLNRQKLDFLDSMDDKLADLRGDIIILMRKSDIKLITLVDVLQQRNLISSDDVQKIMALEPFPR